jgi:hypothetical protein
MALSGPPAFKPSVERDYNIAGPAEKQKLSVGLTKVPDIPLTQEQSKKMNIGVVRTSANKNLAVQDREFEDMVRKVSKQLGVPENMNTLIR